MIEFKELNFTYADSKRPVLSGINLRIQEGEFVLVTGPSGCGKSSLCRCFNGLIPHFYGGEISGELKVCGYDVLKHKTSELATKVGMVFQDPENQIVATDIEREIAFGLENLAFSEKIIAKRVEEALDTVGISGLRNKTIHELSGGEKQKVVIASILALHPDILVLDEPTSELDPKGAEDVLSIVQRLNDELGVTVILVEHRLDRVIHLVDRMIVMNEGRIVADDKPRKVVSVQVTTDVGIGLPPIVRIARKLNGNGFHLGDIPLTVKEGRFLLKDLFKNASRNVLPETPSNGGDRVIEIDRLYHVYSSGRTALKNVNLQIHKGEMVAIMGRNASGKTTLLKHINGLLKPTKGKVKVAGMDTRKVTVAELARKVGFVFQNPNDHIFADTVEEEIDFVLKNLGFAGAEISARVEEMLEIFQLGEYRRQYPRSLSGGERQRVALASILVAKPELLILDEPTRGMEYRLKAELMNLLKDYRASGNTVILVTHDVETVAEYADRVILLSEGKVIVDDNKREVLSQALSFSPQINRLMQAFEKYGVPKNILNVDEAVGLLK